LSKSAINLGATAQGLVFGLKCLDTAPQTLTASTALALGLLFFVAFVICGIRIVLIGTLLFLSLCIGAFVGAFSLLLVLLRLFASGQQLVVRRPVVLDVIHVHRFSQQKSRPEGRLFIIVTSTSCAGLREARK
jgi:hypothetical protein